MKNVSKKLCLLLAGFALVFAGCSKKPARPSPDQTALGPTPGGSTGLSVTDLKTEAGSGLTDQLPAGVIDDGNTIRGLLQAVYFDFDSASVKAAERPKLQAAKDYLDKNPGAGILCEGHADWRGTAEYNLGLGDRRANAAKKYLSTIGAAGAKLEANSKGSLEAKQNATDADAANDRRVDLVIIKPKAL
ncbi:MAG TPA: OmpA family protein [Opitutaceae bacterium]|nr:OmpA family protein [Opitutaceae bacterium]